MGLDTSTLFVAARAMGRVLFIVGIGSVAAQSGLLDKPARSCLANFNLNVFFPALYISVAANFGAYDLVRYAPLWICSLLHILVGYSLALVAARLCRLQPQDRSFLLIMTAFGNCGGLPFVLMQAVCTSSWARVADEHDPVARAFVMIQLYNVPWTLVAFTFGKATVVRAAEEPLLLLSAGRGDGGGDTPLGRPPRASFNHVEALDTEPPSSFQAPDVPMPRSRSFEDKLAVAAKGAAQSTGRLLGQAWRLALQELPLTAALLSICIACVAPLQALLFNGGALDWIGGGMQMLGACSPPVSTLVMASGLWSVYLTLTTQRPADGAHERVATAALPPCKLVLLSCVLRLLVMPAICFPAALGAFRAGLVVDDPLVRLILLIMPAMPSSQTFVSIVQATLGSAATERISALYLPQYAAAMLTVTLATGMGMALV